jgi:hypothetical protein
MVQKSRFNNLTVYLPVFVFLIVALAIFSSKNRNAIKTNIPSDTIFGVQKSSPGEVAVTLKPLEYKNKQLIVYMTVDTYSIEDLDKYNLKEIINLKNGSMDIKPTEVPVLSEHHNIGKLYFPMERLPKKIKISITNLNKPGVRSFSWP